jgi:hypothetical protein
VLREEHDLPDVVGGVIGEPVEGLEREHLFLSHRHRPA